MNDVPEDNTLETEIVKNKMNEIIDSITKLHHDTKEEIGKTNSEDTKKKLEIREIEELKKLDEEWHILAEKYESLRHATSQLSYGF